MKILKEAVAETINEVNCAFESGADRVELCSHLEIGGLTPLADFVEYALSKNLNSVVMIRTNKGFQTSFFDVLKMKKQILFFRAKAIKGFVFGFLTKDNKIDEKATKKLLKLCGNKEKVFHMAFDLIEDKFEAIDKLVELGFTRILTKGGIGKAMDNIETIKKLKEYANGRIELLIGGSVTDENYLDIAQKTGLDQFHGRKLAAGC